MLASTVRTQQHDVTHSMTGYLYEVHQISVTHLHTLLLLLLLSFEASS
jgi:hypothetical protein